LQWLQDPSEINGDNLKIVRREASRYFMNKKGEYLKDKIDEFTTNSKNENIRDLYRGINEFKRDYQSRNNLVKDENGDQLSDSHNILNCFSQLLNVHNAGDVFFIDTLVSLAIPSLQHKLTTSLFSNLDSTPKTNIQYLIIVQCRVLGLICSHILLRSSLVQIRLALCSAFNSDHYAH
jgi:hypothetical protein